MNEIPIVIIKEKEAYQFWLLIHRDFPKVERMGIGNKIEKTFLELLELTFTSAYLQPEQKIIALARAISKLDMLKFFVQLAWEIKLIPNVKFAELIKKFEEIGRMLGGWKKGLQTKTPAK